jgi:hypothetical protein
MSPGTGRLKKRVMSSNSDGTSMVAPGTINDGASPEFQVRALGQQVCRARR